MTAKKFDQGIKYLLSSMYFALMVRILLLWHQSHVCFLGPQKERVTKITEHFISELPNLDIAAIWHWLIFLLLLWERFCTPKMFGSMHDLYGTHLSCNQTSFSRLCQTSMCIYIFWCIFDIMNNIRIFEEKNELEVEN